MGLAVRNEVFCTLSPLATDSGFVVVADPAVKNEVLLFTADYSFSITGLGSANFSCGLAVKEAVKKVFLVD